MGLDINNIKQASPKANQVATEQYVDTSIAGIDVSSDISSNNDIFAQKLGYASYSAMVAAAASGKTVINGGYIGTNMVVANSILANSVSADKISSYNLTSTNATIQNGLITNATIADAAITTAKIGDAQITTAKIGDLSVSTLKIQDEAVIVPRSASTTSGVATIVYTPATSHTITIFSYAKITPNLNIGNEFYIQVNGITIVSNTYGNTSMIGIYNLVAGTSYTITSWYKSSSGGWSAYGPVNLIMLGVKK